MVQDASIVTRALQTESLSADADRLIGDVLLEAGVVGVADDSFEVTEDTGSNLQVKVGSGSVGDKCVIKRDGRVYILKHSNATHTLALSAADANNDRIDLIIARLYDDEADSSGNTYGDIEVVEGTPAPVPAAPSVPDGAIALAEVLVEEDATAVQNADITDRRVEVTLRSGREIEAVEDTTQTSITSATFAAGSPVCGIAFVAPPSGKVWVTVSGGVIATLTAGATRRIELSWELREGSTVGSGSVITAADLGRALAAEVGATSGDVAGVHGSHRTQVSGLTPGAAYNVRTMHRANIGNSVTGTIRARKLAVEPVF